jgi:chromosome partitioning protein
LVFNTIIHRNSKISEAPSFGKPVIAFDIESKGSVNYLHLAKELIENNEKKTIENK